MASISYRNITKRFGSVTAVNNLDLEVREGEFLVLLGPSGCGKTTLLRMTAGLEEVSAGAILMNGRAVNEIAPKDRDIAMVFQSYALYPHLTVAENIGYPLKIRGVDRSAAAAKTMAVAKMLKIEQLLNRLPRELSGGQRQRVALGRAMIREPGAFLMDEPLSNLDAKLRVETRAEIKKLQRDLGKTTLYVTHDQAEAMSLATRVAIFDHGVLQQAASPQEIFEEPANQFVASFVGTPSMNFMAATVVAEGIEIKAQPKRYVIGLKRPASEHGRPVVAGIRPQHIRIGSGGAASALPVKVFITESLGTEFHIFVENGDSKIVIASASPVDLATGEMISIDFEVDKIKLFDPATGLRIRKW
ncbi:MAG: ABC transporter ATP-binding protein [Elusimicrobia bacterium]|nr:ABC transporter ATP-binding protein [Elusimicrobiota bacterium]